MGYIEKCVKMCMWLLVIITASDGRPNKVKLKIGGMFHSLYEQEEALTFKVMIDILNHKHSNLPFVLEPVIVKYETREALKISRKTCDLLNEGVISIVGPNLPEFSEYVQSVSDRKEIPQLLTRWHFDNGDTEYGINLHPYPPMVERMFIDLLEALHWKKFTLIYENDESLSKLHSLLAYKSNDFDIKLRQLTLDHRNSYRGMMNTIKRSGETHFVVVCDLETLKQFLQQSQQVGLLGEKNHYVIYNFDMSNIDMEPYQYGGCNITSETALPEWEFFLVNKNFFGNHSDGILEDNNKQKQVRFVNPTDQDIRETTIKVLNHFFKKNIMTRQNTLNFQAALVADAIKLIHKTLKESEITDYFGVTPLYCNNTDTWTRGSTFLNDLQTTNIRGHTGLVKFDSYWNRSEFVAEIIELTVNGLVKSGKWNSSTGLSIERPPVQQTMDDDEANLRNKTFVVITVLTPPYGMIKETSTLLHGNDRFEGFGVDLIHELSKMLGFNYTFTIQEDGANGNLDKKTNQWTGMVGAVLSKEADLAIGDLTITSERETAVDFTLPFMTLGISILYRKAKPVPPSLFMFASPFSGKVWILLGIAYVFVSMALFVMGRLCPSEWQNPYPCIEEPEYLINQFTFRNSFWFTIGSLMQQGTELAPIGVSTRMLAGVWWFFTLIMVSSYTANLAAFLTVTTLETPFNGIDGLTKQTEIRYGAKSNGATATFFMDSDKNEYRRVWSYILANPDVMVSTNDEGAARVEKENYAFLMESTTIEYVTERRCNLAKIGEQLDEKGYGIAMRKEQKYRSLFNTAILRLQENGQLTTLRIKWWKEKRGGGNCQKSSSAAMVTALNLENVGGVFLVLGVGTFLGVLMSFVELACELCGKRKTQNIKYGKELKKEVKFCLKFKKNVKPVEEYENTDEHDEISSDNKNYLENYINENSQNK